MNNSLFRANLFNTSRTAILASCILLTFISCSGARAQDRSLEANNDSSPRAASKPNVLFISVDDLRPELGCYSKSYMKTPNFDRLAQRGTLFERAYCMVPTCGASRASVMGSVRPAPDRFKTHLTWLSQDAPNAKPLHSLMKESGYRTISLGKVFHHQKDHLDGWSEPPFRANDAKTWQDEQREKETIELYKKNHPKSRAKEPRGPSTESADVDDEAYGDGQVAAKAISYLEEFAANPEQPFFLAVGFYKPHLPFNAPKKYWELYDRDTIELPTNSQIPTDVPRAATHNSGELRSYGDIPPKGPIGNKKAAELIHGYRACVSYTDALLGKVLDALEEKGLAENTIIVLWSDHGWQLGDHGMWNKHSCFETSMWTPLIISVPGDKRIEPAARADGIVELIDIYPTVCELTGIEIPKHVEGESAVPMLLDSTSPGKPFAIGRFKHGDTIRTASFRYSEFEKHLPSGAVKKLGSMMFEQSTDPSESKNLAKRTAFADVKEDLSATLNAHKGRSYETAK